MRGLISDRFLKRFAGRIKLRQEPEILITETQKVNFHQGTDGSEDPKEEKIKGKEEAPETEKQCDQSTEG